MARALWASAVEVHALAGKSAMLASATCAEMLTAVLGMILGNGPADDHDDLRLQRTLTMDLRKKHAEKQARQQAKDIARGKVLKVYYKCAPHCQHILHVGEAGCSLLHNSSCAQEGQPGVCVGRQRPCCDCSVSSSVLYEAAQRMAARVSTCVFVCRVRACSAERSEGPGGSRG